MPEASVACRHLEAGCRVFMVEWPTRTENHGHPGLDEYVDTMLRACIERVRELTGEARVHLCGHSVGGIFAALAAALYPDSVARLALLGTPLNFGPEIGTLGRLATQWPDTRSLIGSAEFLLGSALNMISLLASPRAFVFDRAGDWLACLADAGAMRRHLLAERWFLTHDRPPA